MQQSATIPPPVFVDLNVLPQELRPRRYPAWHVLGAIAILAAGLLLIPLYRAEQASGIETAHLRSELELVSGELAQVQVAFGRARELRQQVETTEAAIVALDNERRTLLGDGPQASASLAAMMAALPPSARLAAVTRNEGDLLLQGRADRTADALAYAGALTASGGFGAARVTSLAIESDQEGAGGVNFTIEATR